MRHLALALFALGTGAALAQDNVRLPRGPSPDFNVVAKVDKATGAILFLRQEKLMVATEITEVVQINGVHQAVTKTVQRPVFRQTLQPVDFKETTVYDSTGKKLSEADVRSKLKAGSVILESVDGLPVDPVYLRAVRPDTLIFVAPRPTPPAPK